MNIITTRTAPAGARFGRPSASHLATVDTMLARAAAFGGGGRIMASATDTIPTDPPPAVPSIPADTTARLDAQDAQLQDHETRISGLERRSPPVEDAGAQGASPSSSAAAATPVATMISGSAIYARMNARSTGLKAAAPTPPASAVMQTAAGSALDTRAMYARLNATAAARTGRGRR